MGVEDRTRYVRGIGEPLDVEERLANVASDGIAPRLVPEIDQAPGPPGADRRLIFPIAKDRERDFPDAWIQAGRFAGRDKSRILDQVEIHALPVIAWCPIREAG